MRLGIKGYSKKTGIVVEIVAAVQAVVVVVANEQNTLTNSSLALLITATSSFNY